jgi:hypothetical protein
MKKLIIVMMLLLTLALPASVLPEPATVATSSVNLASSALSLTLAAGREIEFYWASVYFSNSGGARAATSETVRIYFLESTGARYITELFYEVLVNEYSVVFIPDAPMRLGSTVTIYVTSTNGNTTNYATGIICYKPL